MYAVIYWIGDEGPYPYLNTYRSLYLDDNKKLKTFDKIGEADDSADMIEKEWSEEGREINARVISIEVANYDLKF